MKVTQAKFPRLPGFNPIRKSLGLGISDIVDCGHVQNLHRIDRLNQSASYGTLCALASELCCSIQDLTSEPSDIRLLEIRAAYSLAAAERAQLAVSEAICAGGAQ